MSETFRTRMLCLRPKVLPETFQYQPKICLAITTSLWVGQSGVPRLKMVAYCQMALWERQILASHFPEHISSCKMRLDGGQLPGLTSTLRTLSHIKSPPPIGIKEGLLLLDLAIQSSLSQAKHEP